MVEGSAASWSNARSIDDAEMSGVCAPTITSTLSPASRGAGAPPSKFGPWQALHIAILPAMASGGAAGASAVCRAGQVLAAK